MLINPKFSRARMTVGSWGAVPDRGDEGLSDSSFQKTLEIMRQDGHAKFRVESGTYWLSQGLDFDIDDAEFICPDGIATIYQKTYGTYVARLIGARTRVSNLDLRNPVTKTKITNGNVTQRYLGEFRRQEASALLATCDEPRIENVITRNFIAGVRWIGGKERHYEAALFGGSMTGTSFKLNPNQARSAGYWVGARFKVFGTVSGTWADSVLITGYDAATNFLTWSGTQVVPSGDLWFLLLHMPSEGGVLYNHQSYGEDFSGIFQYVNEIEFAGNHLHSNVVITQGAQSHGWYGSGTQDKIDDSVDEDQDSPPDIPCANKIIVSGRARGINSPEFQWIKFRNVDQVIVTGGPLVADGMRGCCIVEMCNYFEGETRHFNAKTTSSHNRPSALELSDVKRFKARAHLELASDYVWSGAVAAIPAVVVLQPQGRGRTPEDGDLQISGVFRGTSQTTQYGLLAPSTAHPAIGNINLSKVNLRAENSLAITVARIFNTKRVTIGPELDLINVDPSTGAQLAVQSKIILEADCLAGLVDYQSTRTAGPIAVTDNGATTATTTANRVRDRSTEGSRNLLTNGELEDWANTSFALTTDAIVSIATGWKAWRGAASATISQQAGGAGTRYAARLQRTATTTGTASIFLAADKIAPKTVRPMGGKEVTLLFAARRGANFSASNMQLRTALMCGTGVDEDYGTTGFPTGSSVTANQNVTLGTDWVWYAVRHTVPAGVTNMAPRFESRPAGTAGADDWCEIGPVALIAGASAKPFSALV